MFQVSFYVGQTSQQADISSDQIRENLFSVIRAKYPNGHTFSDVVGGWVNGSGNYILENTVIVTVITDNIDNLETIKNALCAACFQDSVMVTVVKLDRVLF